MDSSEIKTLLAELISGLKDKAGYLKSIDSNAATFNQDYYDGMAMAYHQVLDFVKTHLEDEETLELSEFGLQDFDPVDILGYKPGTDKYL